MVYFKMKRKTIQTVPNINPYYIVILSMGV